MRLTDHTVGPPLLLQHHTTPFAEVINVSASSDSSRHLLKTQLQHIQRSRDNFCDVALYKCTTDTDIDTDVSLFVIMWLVTSIKSANVFVAVYLVCYLFKSHRCIMLLSNSEEQTLNTTGNNWLDSENDLDPEKNPRIYFSFSSYLSHVKRCCLCCLLDASIITHVT